MIKVGVADYGMYVWYGGLYDYGARCADIKSVGYEGLERLRTVSESDAVHKAGIVRRLGMDFATCQAPDPEHCIEWTAAFGKSYVWVSSSAQDFDTLCRHARAQAEACVPWNVRAGLHNHLGTLVETQEELLRFLDACPGCGLILDTAHLSVAEGGDPLHIIRNYFDRIVAVHVKDWFMKDESAPVWHEKGYFCELGGGNYPVPNEECVKELAARGYDGWILVEHDTHLRDPLLDLAASREKLRSWGV